MRVYDSKTNTFGSYNPDGSTKTFFKPDPIRYPGTSYFDKQPGILVKK
jgi:pyocin large subunit-like protein